MTSQTRSPLSPQLQSQSQAGWLMAGASALTILFMFHHPTEHGGTGLSPTKIIHAGMMVWLSVIFLGFMVVAKRRGFTLATLAATLAYGISLMGHLGAATISGFLTARLAINVDHTASHDLFVLLAVTNRVLAETAVAASSIAFLLFAIHFLMKSPRQTVLAIIGIVAGLVPALALFSGMIAMDVHGALMVYGAHAIFTGAVGVQLARGKI
jgi:hypothetical protein